MSKQKVDQSIIDLWEAYVHVHFDRRIFLDKAARLLGSASAVVSIIPLLQSNYANAATIAEDDPHIVTESESIAGASAALAAYLAKPKAPGRYGGVLVIHQNRGLNPHIEDVARRFAAEGFVTLAVDFLSPVGGTPRDEEQAIKLFARIDPDKAAADAKAAVAYLRGRPDVDGKVGAIGFCWGGSIVNRLAENDATLDAAVVYYGGPPPLDKVDRIRAPLLLNYADPKLDKWLGPLLPDYEKALQAAGIKYTLHVYQDANHAFNDDTQSRYDPAAAKLAWTRTLAFFKQHLD
ncbi:MAG: dienelactone hydrolase family protein [Beijerinckiaceae bacterium]